MGLGEFLNNEKVLIKKRSKYNGMLTVRSDLTWGTYIQTGLLTQSGGVARLVWETTLGTLKDEKFKNILVLGLAGGGVAKILRKQWPKAQITGVEIDPLMVELGEKYMKLKKYNVDTHIVDAREFLKNNNEKYDLILVDMYVGEHIPEMFTRKGFVKDIKTHLSKSGVAVFNRLYYDEKRKLAMQFLKVLEGQFKSVDPVYPEANVMFVCK